ncbi:MAG: GNAT family N-acetyltransferase [Chloroflexota bacterium]
MSDRKRDWPLVVRRARPSDRAAVLGFATKTWNDWDYIPNAWPVWLDAPDGVLLVAAGPDDRAVAISRVAMVSETEAWLEGIRVDPAVRGMDVATDLQVAELHWAAAQDASVLRYATSARNEASHRLGARHGIELLVALHGYLWSLDPDEEPDEPSAFDADVRAAASALRATVLAGFVADGRIAAPADAARLWRRLDGDATFNAARRLYEPRPWAMGELSEGRFARHLERGEVVVFGGSDGQGTDWALAILLREQLPGEDSTLRLALLCGDVSPAIDLLDRTRALAWSTLRFRLADASPLRTTGHDQLDSAGYHSGEWTLHLLGRPIDADHPIPDVDPARLVLADPPQPILEPPAL